MFSNTTTRQAFVDGENSRKNRLVRTRSTSVWVDERQHVDAYPIQRVVMGNPHANCFLWASMCGWCVCLCENGCLSWSSVSGIKACAAQWDAFFCVFLRSFSQRSEFRWCVRVYSRECLRIHYIHVIVVIPACLPARNYMLSIERHVSRRENVLHLKSWNTCIKDNYREQHAFNAI